MRCPLRRADLAVSGGHRELTCESEGCRFAVPVRARRRRTRERLPSYWTLRTEARESCMRVLGGKPHPRAPFRLLSIRTPRQAVLRTSSLASAFSANRPCDLPANKTRDASNQLLPPNRTACTRTSCVPGSLSPLSQRGCLAENKAPFGVTGGPDVSRRPRPLRRVSVIRDLLLRLSVRR
jgi:hypothetical protein